MTDAQKVTLLTHALADIRDCAGQPAKVYRLAVLALAGVCYPQRPKHEQAAASYDGR